MAERILVNEIFFSIQGEASHAGRPCIFVRTTGCQMRCSWCDTEYSFYEGQKMSIGEILDRVASWPCRLVEITGGEPLIQKAGVVTLMNALLERGYEVLLETGGGIALDGIPDPVVKIVDVKCPESGELQSMNWDFLEQHPPNTQLKFVINSSADYGWAKVWLRTHHERVAGFPIWFSPVWGSMNPAELARLVLEDGLNVRMQPQLHKVIWGAEARGV